MLTPDAANASYRQRDELPGDVDAARNGEGVRARNVDEKEPHAEPRRRTMPNQPLTDLGEGLRQRFVFDDEECGLDELGLDLAEVDFLLGREDVGLRRCRERGRLTRGLRLCPLGARLAR